MQVIYNANKLAKLVKQKESLQDWLTYNQNKYDRNPGKRPTKQKGFLGLWGERVDAIDFYTAQMNALVKEESIRETIEDAGFEATLMETDDEVSVIATCRLRIKGMTCTSCSSTVESTLEKVQGVKKVVFALATEEVEIRYNPKPVNYKQLIDVIDDTGFEAFLISFGEDTNQVHLKLEGPPSDDLSASALSEARE